MRNKGPNPHHLRRQFFNKLKILSQTLCGLVGGTYHESCTHLIADLFQIP